MPRQARLDAPGTLHHVIVRGIEKRRIVDDNKDRADFVNRLGLIASDTGTTIYAWALLTNHAHILLRSSESGLSGYMRRLLTGYAIRYNNRHKRHGHLFQNRYKSIICDEDAYFMELVRYIHLNPLRAGMVRDLDGLARYKWCGHAPLLNRHKNDWQACDYVLSHFGSTLNDGRSGYREYVAEGVALGRRPELVGGGLIRSLGGWFEVKTLQRKSDHVAGDERILGSGEFVERMLRETEGNARRQFSGYERKRDTEKLIQEYCIKEDINIKELQAGSRRQTITQHRKKLIKILVEENGESLAETARRLGVSTSAISKALSRG
jgi:REP element-mobilizing transposase RayT